ncbi:MAG: radical SAM protein [Magnetococcales bacterium]|nr:radical SAM protein [Magnetococcales bacterium]
MPDHILFLVPPPIRYADYIHPAYNTKTSHRGEKIRGNVVTDMPLGVLSMSSYVKAHQPVAVKLIDFSTILNKLVDFPFDSFEQFFTHQLSKEEVIDFKPTIIGISVLFTPAYPNLIALAKVSRTLFPDALLLAGGGVPQNVARNLFQDFPGIDGICHGEGEKPLLALLRAPDQRRFLLESSSWITPADSPGVMYQHDFIENLDEIPFYDYDLCQIDDYSINPAITSFYSTGTTVAESANFHIMTSRGCPQHCTFCASHTIHGRVMRYFSVARVREDFFRLKNAYGAKQLIFQDDHFMGDVERALEIIRMIAEMEGVRPVFQNGLALYALKRNVLEALLEAGVEQLTLPVESGNQKVLKRLMKKPLSLNIVRRVVDDCRDLGIYTNLNILIGMPGESQEDMREAADFLKSLNANWFVIMFATPLVGSEMLEICLEKDYLVASHIDTDYKKAIVRTEHFDTESIHAIAYSMNLELNFVANPDMRLGQYDLALVGFHGALKAKEDHLFAHYFAGRCQELLGREEDAERHYLRAGELLEGSTFWRAHADRFGLTDEITQRMGARGGALPG